MTTESESESHNGKQPDRTVRRVLAMLAWVVGGLLAIGVIAVLLFLTLVNVDGVHRYFLAFAQRKASAMLGVPVRLENFELNLPALRVDLYGVTVNGAAPYRTAPLLQVDHIEASARIVSIFHLKWYLDTVEVDHPVVWIIEGAHGESNIPALHGSTGNSNVNLFSLAIRHAVIDHGELYINDHPHNFNANVVDLDLRSGYNPLQNAYNGTISYKNGRIQMGTLQPVPHSIEASFRLEPETFLLHQAKVAIGKSMIIVAGDVQNFNQPLVAARYQLTMDGAEVRQILRQQDVPSGVIDASGTMTYHSIPQKPFLETLTVNGDLSSRALEVPASGRVLPIRNLNARYSVAEGTMSLQSLRADVLGGGITAQGVEKATGSHQGGNMRAEVHGIKLQVAGGLLQTDSLRQAGLRGSLNGTAAASWGATFNDLTARLDAVIAGELNPRPESTRQLTDSKSVTSPPPSVPLQGEVHGTYRRKDNRLELANTYLQTPDTSFVLNGATGKLSNLAVRLQSSNLGELAELVSLFATRRSQSGEGSLELAGQGSFQGNISGVISAPHIDGQIEANHLGLNGSSWKTIHVNIALNPSLLRIKDANLVPESQGSIQFSGNAALDHWSFNKASPVEVTLNASRLKVSEFLHLAKQTAPVTGTLTAALHVSGSAGQPRGNGMIQLTDATAYNQPVRSATATVTAERGDITGTFNVDVAGGQVSGRATVNPNQRTYSGHVKSTGIHVENFKFMKANDANTQGVLMIDADARGTFDNPEIDGDVRFSKASIQGHVLSGTELHVSLVNRTASANISSSVDHAPIKAHATVAMTGSYPLDVSLDTEAVPLHPLLSLYAPDMADEVTGQTQIHLELHGPLKDKRALVGEVTIPILSVTYNNVIKVAATGPIRIDYQQGSLRVQPMSIQGTDTNLQLQGTVPLYGNLPLSLQVQGNVNLQIAQLFDPELRSAGMARIDIHSGNSSNGGLAGQIAITGANVSYGTVPIGLSNGNGLLTLNGDRIDVTKFNGSIGGGTVTAQGGVALRPKLRFDLGMTATNVRMIYPQGMWENVDANLRFTGSTDRALMGGTIGISDISFTPAFDMTSMIGQFSTGVAAPTSPGFSQNLLLNIAVHSNNVLTPSSRTMSVAGTAALAIRGTAAHPALIGRVNLTGGGMIFNGNRFVLTGGTVQFVNPNQVRPVLNLTLTTTIQQYDINLRFTGPADQLRPEFTSNPSLPQADIISLLAFGTTTEAKAANATPTNQAAESMIASQVSGQVTSRISKIAGISQLSISPVLTSGTAAGPPGAVITIRQQVTGNLFITFSTNVASTQDQTIQGQYRLSPRVSISATRDPNGGFAVDTLIRKTW